MNRWRNTQVELYRAAVRVLTAERCLTTDDDVAADLADAIDTLMLYVEGWETAKWGHR